MGVVEGQATVNALELLLVTHLFSTSVADVEMQSHGDRKV